MFLLAIIVLPLHKMKKKLNYEVKYTTDQQKSAQNNNFIGKINNVF
jgi:hypothetical protein